MAITEALAALKAMKLPKGKILIVGSGIMEVYNLRKSGDLDVLVPEEVFNKGLPPESIGKVTKRQVGDKIEFCLDDPTSSGFGLAERLSRAEMHFGFPFSSLADLLFSKARRGTPKDLDDAKLIRDYLVKRSGKPGNLGITVRHVAHNIIDENDNYYGKDLLDLIPIDLQEIILSNENLITISEEIDQRVVFVKQVEMAQLLGLSDNFVNIPKEKKSYQRAVNSGRGSQTSEVEDKKREICFSFNLAATVAHQ